MSRYSRHDPDEDSLIGDMWPLITCIIALLLAAFFSGLSDAQQRGTSYRAYLLQDSVEHYAHLHDGRYPMPAEVWSAIPDTSLSVFRSNPYRPWAPVRINASSPVDGDLYYLSDGRTYEIIGYGAHRNTRINSEDVQPNRVGAL